MRIDLYGRKIETIREASGWKVFQIGSDGKKRPATDIVIPPSVGEEDLLQYLDDLMHEHATPEQPAAGPGMTPACGKHEGEE